MRLLSYNIHKGVGGSDRRYRLERILDVIVAEEPDLVCLQEVDFNVRRSHFHDQPTLIAARLESAAHLYQLNVPHKDGGYGNLVLARWPFHRQHHVSLRMQARKPRGAQLVVVDTPAGSLHLVNWHLGLAERERRWQVNHLLRHHLFLESAHLPTVIVGDYNDWRNTLGKHSFVEHRFVQATAPAKHFRSFPAFLALASLDKCYFRGDVHIQQTRIVRSRLARRASDHLPLVVDFALPRFEGGRAAPMSAARSNGTTMSPRDLLTAIAADTGTSAPLDMPSLSEPRHVRVAGQELTLFVETWPLIKAMVEDIRAAQKRVWLESYIFHNDAAGKAIAAALTERARAGLDVRVLYDAIGSQATPTSFFLPLQRAGVQVHAFHSLWEALWHLSFTRILNHRNHRKLLVIDDRIAYFGGMNIVDVSSTAAAARAERLPLSAAWRDVHIRLLGPQQGEIAASFDRSWLRAKGEPKPNPPRDDRSARLAEDGESIQFFDSGPALKHARAGRFFTRLINHARSNVILSMAYFLPVGRVLRALFRARRRGVLVRVVVPGNSDVPIVQYACRHLYTHLLRRRFHIHERQGNMLHSKVMIIDDQWTVVGSANLDARSLWFNLEFIALIHSRKLAQVMNDIVAYEVAHSQRVTLRAFREQSWWRRLRDRLAWALRWWL